MCNRYRNRQSKRLFTKLNLVMPDEGTFDLGDIRPTDKAPVIRRHPKSGAWRVDLLRWGLVPPEPKLIPKRPLTNARAETVRQLPTFAEPFRRQRCLIPADGWYEWLTPNDPDGKKIKHLFEVEGGEPFCFAGLYEVRHEPDKEPIRSFTMITTEPTPAAAAIHNRMPVVLEPEIYKAWLDPATDPLSLKPWLRGWQGELNIQVAA